MVRPGQPARLVEVISELGIFGYVIGSVARTHNTQPGFVV